MTARILMKSSLLMVIIMEYRYMVSANGDDELQVQTDLGYVRGITIKTPTEKDVDAFLGIPYADPPIGLNRFRAPQPKQPWQGVYHADRILNACAQLEAYPGFTKPPSANSSELEDCLYLNVWLPKPRKEKLAVMVFIHGGGFTAGSSGHLRLDGGTLASEEEVIVVSLNYRLYLFGFLYMEGTDAPGNMGLLDQIAALQWIQRNIANFGGDPGRVTVFGFSAGGISVALHLLSEKSKSLFESAIIQSGTSTMLKMNRKLQTNFVLKLAQSLECPHDPNDKQVTVECLRTVSKEELLAKAKLRLAKVGRSPFNPVADGEFLKEDPGVLQTQKGFNNANVMIGSTSEDGAVFPVYYGTKFFLPEEGFLPNRTLFRALTKGLLPNIGDLALKLVDSMYTDWLAPDDPKNIRVQMVRLFTDYLLDCGINELCNDLTMAGRKVYRYQFSHVPSTSKYPKWMGSVHVHEVDFVFGNVLHPDRGYNKQEILLSKKVMKYWTNFAKYGDPNGQPENPKHRNPEWPRYTIFSKDYLNISNSTRAAQHGIRLRACAFWKQIFPEIERRSIIQSH